MSKPVITKQDEKELWAEYKHHIIEILKEDEGYYIIVQGDGGYLYDGYWGDDTNTFQEALDEALDGSELKPTQSVESEDKT